MPQITVRLLQTPVIELDGEQITFSLKKSDALFFYLCVEKNTTRTNLAHLLWGGQPEESARKNLRNALYAIKQSFGFDPFESPKKQILKLNSRVQFQIDTDRFLAEQDPALYQGSFLSGFSLKDSYEYDEWMNSVRSRFLDLYLQLLYQRFQELPADDLLSHEELFHRYVNTDALDERIYLQMMQVYQHNGQFRRGIQCYERLVQLLKEELNLSPSQEISALYRELVQEWSQTSAASRSAGSSHLLVGRSHELSTLRQSWQQLQLKKGSTIFLTGEKGIGKTYLIDSFLEELPEDGALILRTDCLEEEKNVPLRPWNHIFLQINRRLQETESPVPGRVLASIHSVFPVMESLSDLSALPRDISASYNYRAVKNSIISLFSLIGKKSPVILYINDLQNMDTLSADWLSALIRQNTDHLLILITAPAHMDAAWDRYIGGLVTQRNVRKIILGAFRREDVREVLSERLPGVEFSPAQLDRLFSECQGNPFFLDIIISHLQSDATEFPARAQDILNQRLASLPPEERQLLDLISLFHDYTTAEPLQRITDCDPLKLLDRLEHLEVQEFLAEEETESEVHFRYRHEKMREYVRHLLPPSKARLYHRRIAEYLESASLPHNSRWFTQLIYHYNQCGDPARSLYFRILQFEAYSDLNYELYPVLSFPAREEKTSFRETLAELEDMERQLSHFYTLYPGRIPYEEAQCRLSLTIGKICIQQGDYQRGLPVLEQEMAHSSYLPSHRSLKRAYRRQFAYYAIQTLQPQILREALEECLIIDQERGEISELAVDHRLLGLCHTMAGEYEEAEHILRQSIDEFHHAPLAMQSYTVNLAACYNYLGENCRRQGQYGAAVQHYRKAIDICRDGKGTENPTFYVNLAQTQISQHRLEQALDSVHRAAALYELSNIQMGRCMCFLCESYILSEQGNFEESRAALEAALSLAPVLGSPRDIGYSHMLSAWLKFKQPEIFSDLLPESAAWYEQQMHTALRDIPGIPEISCIDELAIPNML